MTMIFQWIRLDSILSSVNRSQALESTKDRLLPRKWKKFEIIAKHCYLIAFLKIAWSLHFSLNCFYLFAYKLRFFSLFSSFSSFSGSCPIQNQWTHITTTFRISKNPNKFLDMFDIWLKSSNELCKRLLKMRFFHN